MTSVNFSLFWISRDRHLMSCEGDYGGSILYAVNFGLVHFMSCKVV